MPIPKKYDYAICSGYFDPIHEGHLDLFEACQKLGEKVWVIVNNDMQIKQKKRVACFSEDRRVRLVSSIKGVDHVTLSYDSGPTIELTLGIVLNHILKPPFFKALPTHLALAIRKAANMKGKSSCFVNSGDRTQDTASSVEENICKKYGCDIEYVKLPKTNSSSLIIQNIIRQYENTIYSGLCD